jgi:uncharacterized damage-inducible protein DinB
MSEEKAALHDALRSARRHILGVADGLSEDEMTRAVLPSGWTIAELVHHLAVDVERFWFRAVMAGDQDAWASFTDDEKGGWTVPAELSAADVVALYQDEAGRSDAVIEATDLGAAPASWPDDLFGSFRMDDLREVLVHVVQEQCTHAGHLDAARELIDGKQWMVL